MQISENDNANVPQVAENNSWTPRKCKRTRSPRFFSFDTTSLSGSLIFFKVSVFCCFLLCDGWNKINLIFYQVCFAHEILAGVNCASCSFEYFTSKACGLWRSKLFFRNRLFSVILGSPANYFSSTSLLFWTRFSFFDQLWLCDLACNPEHLVFWFTG